VEQRVAGRWWRDGEDEEKAESASAVAD